MPQRANALRVAPIFGPRYVAKLVRSAAATACAWLLAIFRKLTATWHTWVFNSLLALGLSRARKLEEYVRYVRKLAGHSGKDPSVLEEPEARAYLR